VAQAFSTRPRRAISSMCRRCLCMR
jgi:hypothetical protein